MTTAALFAVVMLCLCLYSLLLIAVFTPRAYRNGYVEGRRAGAHRQLRVVPKRAEG